MKLENFLFKYNSSRNGLTQEQAHKNKNIFGENVLQTKNRDSFLILYSKQLCGFFSLLLIISSLILFFLNQYIEMYIILAIVGLNSLIETIQKYRSDSIFEELKNTLPSYSIVLRDSKKIKIENKNIVIGDVVVLSAGDKVPVDALVFYSNDLSVDEAILTGETTPVRKEKTENEYVIDSIVDNYHVVFSGSQILTGIAHVLVVAIGDETQIGHIAQKITTIHTELPIHKNIRSLSFKIFLFILILLIFVSIIGVFQNQPRNEIFQVVVALFVSAIPESLPVIITLILVYGLKRMSNKNVLVRKMTSLDALGQINILALDKTGTITKNQMKVEKIFLLDGTQFYITGDGYEPVGNVIAQNTSIQVSSDIDVTNLVQSILLSSDGEYQFDSKSNEWKIVMGDPTEVALTVFAEKMGMSHAHCSEYTLKENIPFSNQSMMHEKRYIHHDKIISFFSGAPEAILEVCKYGVCDGNINKITDEDMLVLNNKIKEFSTQGYRTIASSYTKDKKTIFTGLVAISDSIRLDVADSMKQVLDKGIEVVIITGDHEEIAFQIGKKIGLKCDESTIITGDDMNNLTSVQFENIILCKNIFARVTPQQKLKILETYKKLGKIIAMTGDGVNDSLALVKADIGIAMGNASSEVAKESSDLILLDNKFGSIVYGIEEGKNIILNIKKALIYLLSTNLAELFVVVLVIIFALPAPLSPIAILWLNLVTDTFLVVGFAFERGDTSEIKHKKILSLTDWKKILYLGFCMTAIALFVFIWQFQIINGKPHALVFLVLIIMQWFNILNVRAGEKSVFKIKKSKNYAFTIGWLFSFLLTIIVFDTEYMRTIVHIEVINIYDWLYAIVISSLIVWIEEFRKLGRKIILFF